MSTHTKEQPDGTPLTISVGEETISFFNRVGRFSNKTSVPDLLIISAREGAGVLKVNLIDTSNK